LRSKEGFYVGRSTGAGASSEERRNGARGVPKKKWMRALLSWLRRTPLDQSTALFQPPEEVLTRRDSIDEALERDKEKRLKSIIVGAASIAGMAQGSLDPGMQMRTEQVAMAWRGQDEFTKR
jgi:hypothetical protein